MNLDLFKELENNFRNTEVKNIIDKFINELSDFLKNNSKENLINETNKYSEYWGYQNFMEDNVAANIGISRWSADIRYRDELSEIIDNSILELSQKEGTLYRKQFMASGPTYNPRYSVDKFENGKIEHLIVSKDEVPKGFENKDIIFQYKADGSTKVRNDLKEKAIKLASKNAEDLKEKESELTSDYKKDGHIYQVGEDDGYIFLKDLTETRGYVLEDINFVVDCYQGEGKYQVINGEYKKIDE